MPDTLTTLLGRFRQHLEAERRASPHTVRAYVVDAGAFVAHLEAQGRDQIDIVAVRSFLASLWGTNEAATIARKLSSVRAFLRFLKREGVIAENVALLLSAPKGKRALPRFLSVEHASALVEAPVAPGHLGEQFGRVSCRAAHGLFRNPGCVTVGREPLHAQRIHPPIRYISTFSRARVSSPRISL